MAGISLRGRSRRETGLQGSFYKQTVKITKPSAPLSEKNVPLRSVGTGIMRTTADPLGPSRISPSGRAFHGPAWARAVQLGAASSLPPDDTDGRKPAGVLLMGSPLTCRGAPPSSIPLNLLFFRDPPNPFARAALLPPGALPFFP